MVLICESPSGSWQKQCARRSSSSSSSSAAEARWLAALACQKQQEHQEVSTIGSAWVVVTHSAIDTSTQQFCNNNIEDQPTDYGHATDWQTD